MKTRRAVPKLVVGLLCLAFGGVVFKAYSQPTEYPATIRVPVTFYDFRSDRSNPEFEQPHDGRRLVDASENGQRVTRGMVADQLDRDRKPVLGSSPYMNHGIRFWFRDWQNLNQYSMRTDSSTVDGVRRGYLERFRPLYMYRHNDHRSDGTGGGPSESGRFMAFPPLPSHPYVEAHNGNRPGLGNQGGDQVSRLGQFAERSEWNNVLVSGLNPTSGSGQTATMTTGFNGTITAGQGRVPYLYARVPTTGPTLPTLPTGASGDAAFIRTGTAGTNAAARLNFGSGPNFDYTLDSAFSNIVLSDTLVFNHRPHLGVGVYEFDVDGWFPLRGRGFTGDARNWISTNGNRSNNYSFSMEMVRSFVMSPGLRFSFRGDDDVWVFINNRLALDLGGIHQPAAGTIHLDNLRASHGLVDGVTYDLRMFYVERHADGSNIQIQSNMLSTIIENFDISLSSNDLKAGERVTGTGTLDAQCDPNNPNCLAAGNFYWSVEDVTPGLAASERNLLSNGTLALTNLAGAPIQPGMAVKDSVVQVYAERAYTQLMLTGTFDLHGERKTATVIINVRPGDPAAVFVEASPDSARTLPARTLQNIPSNMSLTTMNRPANSSALRWPDPMDTIRVAGDANFNDQFFGIVRDRFGNWVQPVSAFTSPRNPPYNGVVAWSLIQMAGNAAPTPANFGTILPRGVDGQLRGRGRVDRAPGATVRVATANLQYQIGSVANGFAGANLSTTIPVVLDDWTALAIRIVVLDGLRFIPLASSPDGGVTTPRRIDMEVGEDTTLYVQVRRSDLQHLPIDQQWVRADAVWGSSGAIFETPLSGTVNIVSFAVNAAGDGSVRATVAGSITQTNPDGIFAQVPVRVALGIPVSMRFYGAGQGTNTAPNSNFIHPLPISPPTPPPAVTVRAGQHLTVVPKLFTDFTTNTAVWVQNVSSANFTWTLTSVDNSSLNGNTRIHASGGNANQTTISGRDSIWFRSTDAHETYKIVGTYNRPTGGSVSCSLHIRVIPQFDSLSLVIEEDRRVPMQQSGKIDVLEFDNAQFQNGSPRSVYAVLRDPYNNFVAFAGGYNQYTDQITTYPQWQQFTSVISDPAIDADRSVGEGVVYPRNPGETPLRADASAGVTDTAAVALLRDDIIVRILAYSYDSLAVGVRVNSEAECNLPGAGCIITLDQNGLNPGYYRIYTGLDTLKMNSNEDATFYVIGRIAAGDANNGRWEPVTADWGSDLAHILGNASSGRSWSISPDGSGEGAIRATRPGVGLGDGLTGELNINIEVGPPTGVVIQVIDDGNLRAGQPISGIIHYTNRAGVITEWKDKWGDRDVWLGDILGKCNNTPATRPDPLVGTNTLGYLGITPNHGTDLPFFNILPQASNATLEFSGNGQAAVTFTIYLAGADEHQIRIYHPNIMTGTSTVKDGHVTALSNRFTVRAGDLSTVKIEETNPGQTIPGRTYIVENGDTIIVYDYEAGGQDILISVGYDEWGNRIGRQESDWSTTGNIPSLASDSIGVNQVLFDSRRADDTGTGWVVVEVRDKDGNIIKDSLQVRIANIKIGITRATTRDISATGYLDHIDIEFDKPVKLEDAINLGAANLTDTLRNLGLVVSRAPDNFPVTGIVTVPAGNEDGVSKIWRLALQEQETSRLQTGWTLDVVIPAGLFAEVSRAPLRTFDGAAPVIFEARKYFAQSERDQDYMKVVFSEGFVSQFANPVRTPKDVFNIWEAVPVTPAKRAQRLAKAASSETCGDKFIVGGILDNITAMRVVGDTIEFFLGREAERVDLNTRHFMNIKVDPSFIKDNFDNTQEVFCNRIVPITYGNRPPMEAVAIPNPSSPNPSRVNPGRLNAYHEPDGSRWVREDGGGSIVRVPVYVPKTDEGTIGAQVKVYDLVGNLVHASRTGNLFEKSGIPTGMHGQYMDIDLYWNGYNSKGMKVAPGTYRLIVQFEYSDPGLRSDFRGKNKFTAPVGVSK